MRVKPTIPVLNRAHARARGLIGAWPLYERGGSLARDLLKRANGTINNATWVTGAPGPALDFNGSSAWVSIPYSAALNPPSLAASVWFRTTTAGTAGGGRVLFALAGGAGFNVFGMAISRTVVGAGVVEWGVNTTDDTFWTVNTGSDLYNDGKWHLAVGTLDDGTKTLYLYVDGKRYGSTTWAGTRYAPSGHALGLGTFNYSGGQVWYFTGQIGDFVLCASSASALAALYSDPWALYRPARGRIGKAPAGFYSRYYYDMAGGGSACSRT